MTSTLRTRGRPPTLAAVSSAVAAALVLGACGGGAPAQAPPPAAPAPSAAAPAEPAVTVAEPIAATYDGGIYVLDGSTLQVARDIPLPRFNRLNAAGDDQHLLVTTATGFRVLDATSADLTDVEIAAAKPGHVVHHDGRTVLFADGSGEVTMFDTAALDDGQPQTVTHRTPEPHHGVAIELADGTLITTLGTEETRTGIVALDKDRKEIARNEDCPGVHGEATAQGDAVVVGCHTGALIYKDGTITKVTSPTPYGAIGTQAGTDSSPITLGDYKQDENAELERPTQVSLIDTANPGLKLVDIGASYTFRSLARGPQAEALVLGTDGAIHVIDPAAAAVSRTIPVIGAWEEPLEWQQPRPALFVRGGTAYVSEPATKQIHAVDLASGAKTASVTLPGTPNELNGVTA